MIPEKPCPFCGKFIPNREISDGSNFILHHCEGMDTRKIPIVISLSVFNKRPIEDALVKENDKLKEEIKVLKERKMK